MFLLDILSPRTWLVTSVESINRSRQVSGTSDHGEDAVNCSHRMSVMVCFHQPSYEIAELMTQRGRQQDSSCLGRSGGQCSR